MRNLKYEISGCSNRAYSKVWAQNETLDEEIVVCHKHHDMDHGQEEQEGQGRELRGAVVMGEKLCLNS
jgi:hypothetical protein